MRDLLLAELDGSSPPAGAVVLAGTDTLEELAFSLHLMLGAALRQRWRAPLVLTGAMLPADQLGTDNARNLKDALLVRCDVCRGWGVKRGWVCSLGDGRSAAGCTLAAACACLAHPKRACRLPLRPTRACQVAVDASTPHCALLVMGETIHLAQHVRKADSQLLGAFASHPGPLGQLRGGRPVYYYAPPPPPPPLAAAPHGSEASDADDAFERVPAEALARQRVAIWTLTVGAFLPQALLAELHGLVLAGSGTGSVPAALVEQLAPERTARLPTVIVSRWAERGGVQRQPPHPACLRAASACSRARAPRPSCCPTC